MDPFFTRKHLPWGQHPGYVEDVHRTYGKSLPKRDPAAFKKALQFRAREKEQWQRDRSDRDHYLQELKASEGRVVKMTEALNRLTEQFSSLKAKHERSDADSKRTGGVRPVRDEQGQHGDGASEERTDAVQREVVPSGLLHDSRGQASEHGAEKRLSDGRDAEGNVPVRKEAVLDGGDGASGGESGSAHSDLKLSEA